MSRFNRVILSRKGFDSKSAHEYSRFDPLTRKYIVLPIPYEEIGGCHGNGTKYEDIKLNSGFLSGVDASNLYELVYHESMRFGKWIKKAILQKYAHFDPWLARCPWLEEGNNHHLGAFGQDDTAQSHLNNKAVREGSLFLFFSRFVPINTTINTTKEGDGGIDIKGRHINHEHLSKGLYFIYGWLEVVEVIREFEDIDNSNLLSEKEKKELKERHPHATKDYFDKCKGKNNTIYLADSQRCGYFPKLTDDLLLTATDSAQPYNDWLAGRWELPGFFYKYPHPTYFPKDKREWASQQDSKTCVVRHPCIGQEFVFDDSEEFYHWFNKLLGETHNENHKNK